MDHTKRSPEFRKRLADIVTGLRNLQETVARTHLDGVSEAKLIDDAIVVLKINTTDSGCVVNAAPDEPIFTLRGKDTSANCAISEWINDAIKSGKHADKLDDAEFCLQNFIKFQTGRKRNGS